MTILPHDSQRVGTNRHYIRNTRGGCVAELGVEHLRIRLGFHVLMPTAAGGTRASRAQQLKWINACVSVVPGDGKFSLGFVGCNTSWFFVHITSVGTGSCLSLHEIMALE